MAKPRTLSVPASQGNGTGDSAFSTVRSELTRARALARSWAEALPDTMRTEHAALFARRAIKQLSAKIAPGYVLNRATSMPFGELDSVADHLAMTIGDEASQLPLIEALHFVTSLYPALLPKRCRSALGAFYTPPVLCSRLLDQVTEAGLDWATSKVLDPAAGSGAFLFHAAQRMREAMSEVEPNFVLSQLGSRLLGLEIDNNAAELAQAALEILLSDLSLSVGRPVPQMVRCCDTLDTLPEAVFDLVMGNPPYGRVALTPAQRNRYSRSLYGHANLYGVFTDIALRWVKPGGIVAFLTPTSFLAGQYFAALRDLLAHKAPPVAMDFVHARRGVFEDVLQETMLAIYRAEEHQCRIQIHYLHVENEREARITRNGTVGLPALPSAPWLAPRDPAHSRLIARAETMTARLSDWGYSVSTGPLVWNRYKTQLRTKSAGRDVRPLVWAESVTADGTFLFRAEKRSHTPYFKLEQGDDWLLTEEPCVLVQRTTSKEQSRRLIAAELPATFIAEHGGVVVENHLNMVRPQGRRPKVAVGVVAALLNSRIVDDLFRCMNGSVAVSAFELSALPLPDITTLKLLTQLVSQKASRERIDAECARLYGEHL